MSNVIMYNWKVIYEVLYVFHAHFDNICHRLWSLWPLFDLWKWSNVQGHKVNWKIINDFIATLLIASTVSEILV